MKRHWVLGIALAAGIALVAWAGNSSAHENESAPMHSHEKCERHGGDVTMAKGHHFETVWTPAGLRIYMYGENQAPQSIQKAKGTVTFEFKDGTSKEVALNQETPAEGEVPTVYFCPMHPDVVQMQPGTCPKCGGMKLFTQDRLTAKLDLAKVEPGSLKAVVKLAGLAGPLKTAVFTEAFTGLKKDEPAKEAHPQG